MTEPVTYQLTAATLLPALSLLPVVAMGLTIIYRERHSALAPIWAGMLLSVSIWQLGISGSLAAPSAAVALNWQRLSMLGILLAPSLIIAVTGALLERRDLIRQSLWLLATTYPLFAFLLLGTSHYLAPPHHYQWGYYFNYRPVAFLFGAIMAVSLLYCIALLWRAYRSYPTESIEHQRAKPLVAAALLSSGQSLDLLPAFGIGIYPLGFLFVAVVVAAFAYVTLRYRLTDITPALAARSLVRAMGDGVVMLDRSQVVRLVNPAAEALLGYPAEALLGKPLPPDLRALTGGDRAVPKIPNRVSTPLEVDYDHPDGRARTLSLRASWVYQQQRPEALLWLLQDLTAQREAENRARRLAYYDPLTELPNRRFFREHLQAVLETGMGAGSGSVFLLFIDLYKFKDINDTHGHEAGDLVLRTVAGSLAEQLAQWQQTFLSEPRPQTFLARLAGDEFVTVISGELSDSEIHTIGERLLRRIRQPIEFRGRPLFISGSVGFASYPRQAHSANELLQAADLAMYAAKGVGPNTVRMYRPIMQAAYKRRLTIIEGLRRALSHEELVLHYQPQIDVSTGRLQGLEALLRWRQPNGLVALPGEFISVAEEAGLITEIGEWVLHQACGQLARWDASGLVVPQIAVNVSARQLKTEELSLVVETALRESALEGVRLELEITETAMMDNLDRNSPLFHDLKALGVQLTIDDFGTGYSSLNKLKRLPFAQLKIDHSFIADLPEDRDDLAIIQAVVALADTLRLTVIAEGIEHPEQAALLRTLGVTIHQGYYYAAPMPADAVEAFVRHTPWQPAVAIQAP